MSPAPPAMLMNSGQELDLYSVLFLPVFYSNLHGFSLITLIICGMWRMLYYFSVQEDSEL